MEVVKEIDELGRVVLPKKWRDKHNAKKVRIKEVEDSLQIIPLKVKSITDFYDSITVDVPPEVFRDPHELRKALRRSP